MTIKEMRELLGLSQVAFSEKYNIPKRSIENWESGTRQCPDYVMQLLEQSVLRDGGRVMKIYEYQKNDGSHYYAGTFRRGESCMWELDVALPQGVDSYEGVTGETIVTYKGDPYTLYECLLPNRETPTLRFYTDNGSEVFYSMKVLSRRELNSVRTID